MLLKWRMLLIAFCVSVLSHQQSHHNFDFQKLFKIKPGEDHWPLKSFKVYICITINHAYVSVKVCVFVCVCVHVHVCVRVCVCVGGPHLCWLVLAPGSNSVLLSICLYLFVKTHSDSMSTHTHTHTHVWMNSLTNSFLYVIAMEM